MNKVVRNIRRVDPATVKGYAELGVSTVHEAQGRKGLLAPYLRPLWPRAHIAGPAVTVEVPPCDNWMIHVAVEQCRPGDVMVVAPTSFSDAGYFGELIATSLVAHGVVGLILDAGARDVAAIADMKFPVWSKAIFSQGTVKETLGNVNIPVVCAGQTIYPGDLIVADDDGVVVVRKDEAKDVLEASNAREAKEAQSRKRLRAGELSIDINTMRERLAEKGLRYVDSEDEA
jgi:4-hydroxy-4-methyl-2-oxoglutarate aldolase